MHRLHVYAACALLCTGLATALPAQGKQTCRRSVGNVLGQFAVATVGAWAGGAIGYTTFDRGTPHVTGDAGYFPNANTAFALGSWAGSTIGAYWAGKRRSECGRFWTTAVGTFVPTVPLLFGRHQPYLPLIGAVYVAPLQAVGGVIGFPSGRTR